MAYEVGLAIAVILLVVVFVWLRARTGRVRAAAGSANRSPTPGTGVLDAVRFDTTGWELMESADDRAVWTDADGDALSVNRVEGLAPEGMLPLDDLAAARAYGRELAERDERGAVGIVSVDVVRLGDRPALTLIYKREKRPAYAYTGMIVIPRERQRLVIVVAAVERGITGARDALVAAQLVEAGALDPENTDANGRLLGWFRDPYDPSFDATALNSVADDEQYDELVPSHPLSKVRRTLRTIRDTIRFERADAGP